MGFLLEFHSRFLQEFQPRYLLKVFVRFTYYEFHLWFAMEFFPVLSEFCFRCLSWHVSRSFSALSPDCLLRWCISWFLVGVYGISCRDPPEIIFLQVFERKLFRDSRNCSRIFFNSCSWSSCMVLVFWNISRNNLRSFLCENAG